MRRNPGRKNRRTSAPITRAVATIAPRTSSDNARPSGPSLFEDCALDSRRKRLRPMGAYIRPRRARHESESRQDLCAGLRRRPEWWNPGRVRRPCERGAGDHEVFPHVFDPVPERTPRKPQVRILHPRTREGSDPRAHGLDGDGGPASGGTDRDPRHGKYPQEPELPPGARHLARTVQDVLQERDEGRPGLGPRRRLSRRPRDDGEDARSSVRTLLPLRVVARPRDLDLPDFGETARPRDRRLVPRRSVPCRRDSRPRDAFDVRPVRATSPAGREDARHETRHRVLRVLLRRWVVRGDAGRQRDRIGVIRHLFGMGPPNAYELSDEIANLLASPLYPPGNWCDVLREGILASVQAPTDPPWPRRLPLRSRGRTAQPPLPSSWLTATKTTRF